MQIKRYEASSVQEALTKIRKDLGQDAVILSTKRLRRGKIPFIEVTAARDTNEAVYRKADGATGEGSSVQGSLRSEIEEIRQLIASLKTGNAFRMELTELKETLNSLFDLLGFLRNEQGNFSMIYHHLIAGGMSRERAFRLTERLKSELSPAERDHYRDALKRVEDLIKKDVPLAERKNQDKRVIAFLGPTGVGKTTTLAKLAAHYALDLKKKVGLITADTYRIAATEQLKVYARIMGLPIEIAAEKESFGKALSRFSDRDLVLVDTPGRSQSDENYIRKLKELFAMDVPCRNYLLLSLTAGRESMMDAALKFSPVQYDSIIFTKVDESVSFGSIYDIIDQVGKPVSYLTNGQNVPKDIERATPGRIARLIVGNRMN
ncbi:MAG: flagellar biosynthesis protein FlhF [Syntrophales bacterium]